MPAETAAGLLARYGLPPAEIERLSLARLEAAAGLALPADPLARQVARRVLYAAGDPGLASSLRVPAHAVNAAVLALRSGATVIVDVAMVAAGLRHAALRELGCELLVTIEQPAGPGVTRSAAGMLALAPRLTGAVVVIGNAPTALLALLDLVDAGAATPAAIVGMPVGLVAAAESKAELARRSVPSISVLGTRGGSPLAAAALNALLELALADGR